MKIFHLISGRVWGGSEIYALTLAKEQRDHGHNVEIICPNRPLTLRKFQEAGFKVHVIQLNGHLNLFSPFKIAHLLRHNDDTVLHIHRVIDTPLAAKAIKKINSKRRPALVCTHHLTDPARTGKKFDKGYAAVDRFICVSNKSREGLLSSDTAIDREKVRVIHNSIKTTPSEANHLSDENGQINALFVGRISPEKGLDTAIEALPFLPEITLTVCGTGKEEYVSTLRALAQSLKVENRIVWVGFTDSPTDYISRAEIGLVPSRWCEAFGLVIIEFMANGVPVVTSDNGAQPEIITDGIDGFLVAPDDPKALANAVRRLIDDPALRKKMGEAARKTFENRFTYDNFYRQVMDIYDEALAAKNDF